MPGLVKLVRYEDKKAEALTFIDGFIRHYFKKRDKGDIGLYKLISYNYKKGVEAIRIEDDIDTAYNYIVTAAALSFLYDMLCPGDLLDKDINDDESVKKLTNGETLTDDEYQYLVALYNTRFIKSRYEKNVSKCKKYQDKMLELAIKWILNPGEEADSSTNATEDSER